MPLALLLLLGAQPQAFAKRCVQVKPGAAIDRYKLGMSRAQLEKLGAKAGPMSSMLKLKDYSFYLSKKNTLDQIELQIPGSELSCIQIGKKKLNDKSPAEAFAIALGDCGRFEPRTGGNVSQCKSGAMVTQHMGGFSVRVVPSPARTTDPSCDGYISPGQLVASPGKTQALSKKAKLQKLKIEAGKNYCLGGRVISSALKPEEVTGKHRFNSCRTQTNIGATIVDCAYDGVRFVFAGPRAAWARAEVFPAKAPHSGR